ERDSGDNGRSWRWGRHAAVVHGADQDGTGDVRWLRPPLPVPLNRYPVVPPITRPCSFSSTIISPPLVLTRIGKGMSHALLATNAEPAAPVPQANVSSSTPTS